MDFAASSIIAAYSALVSEAFELCHTVLEVSFGCILKKTATVSIRYKELLSTFRGASLNENLHSFKVEIENCYTTVLPDISFAGSDGKNISWADNIGPYMWGWIHIVSQYIDLNGGLNEKRSFIEFIERLILCRICQLHYKDNKPAMMDSLAAFSLSDVFLILHTCTQEKVSFLSDASKRKKEFKQLYFDQFKLL